MEAPVAAETEEIEFQALALDHADIGDIADPDFGKVGLTGDRAERGKFRAVETNPVIVVLVQVLKGLQHLGRIVLRISGFAAQRFQAFFFSTHYISLILNGLYDI